MARTRLQVILALFVLVSHTDLAQAHSAALIPNSTTPHDAVSFCKRTTDDQVVPKLAEDLSNLTGFPDAGGILNLTGDCWWHSRLQRSALYLTVFRPDLPRPHSTAEVHEIFKALQHNTRVVEIGGFNNWEEFSTAWSGPLQRYLNEWQLGDTFIRQAWFNGILNRWPLHGRKAAARLKKLVEAIVDQVNTQKKIAYVKLSMKFPAAHAWLVTKAVLVEDGVDLTVIDSNFSSIFDSEIFSPGPYVYHYKYGQESFNMWNADLDSGYGSIVESYGNFNPFIQHEDDFKPIQRAISNYCQTVLR